MKNPEGYKIKLEQIGMAIIKDGILKENNRCNTGGIFEFDFDFYLK
jgi:hypothetical protein